MKKVLFLFCISFLMKSTVVFSQGTAGADIKIRIAGLRDTTCVLAYYYGDKQYIKDTLDVDAQGWMNYKATEALPGGIYILLLPDKSYFEFLVTNQQFTLETVSNNLVMGMKVKNSEDNRVFYKYLSFIEPMKKKADQLNIAATRVGGNPDSVKIVKEMQAKLDQEVIEFKKNIMADNPDAFMTKVFKASEPPSIPPGMDSTAQFYFYKSHFFDQVDFSDDRLLRTPVFHQRLKEYFDNLVLKIADSAKKDCDYVIEKARANAEVFKYVVIYTINKYANEKIMCMDAVYAHIARQVYMGGEAVWADSATKEKMYERVRKLEPCLCGKIATNIAMRDTSMVPVPLMSVNSKYVLLVFWDYDCGHCKKEMPMLAQKYDSLKAMGVEVYAVCTRLDPAPWKKFIREHNFPKWINAADLENKTRFRDYYDIYSTPVIYVLDKEKRIIGKRIDAAQTIDFILNYEKVQKEKLLRGEKP